MGGARWPGRAALLVIGVIYALVSQQFTPGPRGLILVVVVVVIGILALLNLRKQTHMIRVLAIALSACITLSVIISTGLLVAELLYRSISALTLLQDAALVWIVNVLTFSVWYWEIDSGGPAMRKPGHPSRDFLFPQVAAHTPNSDTWSPGYVDYLFLAFNTSTAFSPTDTAVLSRRAKLLMMLQALISIIVIAVLAARAINTF